MLRRAAETTRGRLAILIGAIAAVTLFTAAIAHFALDEFPSYGSALWSAILHLLDPSSLHDDEGTGERAIGLVQVVSGLVLLVGVLFTVIADVMSTSLRRLGQIDRPVNAKDHLLVVGATGMVPIAVRSLAESLTEAGSSQRIVVLAPESERESRAQLLSELEDAAGAHRLDLLYGDTAGDSGFELAAAASARTILLLSSSSGPIAAEAADVEVTQSGLALTDHLRERGASPTVRMLFRRGRNVDAAWELFPSEWDAIVGDRSVGAVLRLALTRPRVLAGFPGGLPRQAASVEHYADLLEAAWRRAREEGRPLRLVVVGCGFNAPALMEDLSQAGADRFSVTVLAAREAFESYLGSADRHGVDITHVDVEPTEPERLLAALDSARADAILVTPSPTTFNPRGSDAEVTLAVLHVLRSTPRHVPIATELFLPETAARLPGDERLLPLSSLRVVVIGVTLSVFDPRRGQELEAELAAEAAGLPGS